MPVDVKECPGCARRLVGKFDMKQEAPTHNLCCVSETRYKDISEIRDYLETYESAGCKNGAQPVKVSCKHDKHLETSVSR